MKTPDNWCTSPDTEAKPPTGTAGGVYPVTPSALCSMGWRSLMITGLLRDMLARHFAESAQIEETDLRHYVWREHERTGILIESINRWRGDLTEKRPAVIIKSNGRRNIRWGIQDYAGANGQGHKQYQTFWAGSHTLFCIHGSGASAEILGTEVQRELHQWHPIITSYLGLHMWQVSDVGGTFEIEEAKESHACPVNIGWVYSEKWTISLESLKLRKVPLSILLDGAVVNQTK